MNLALMNEKLQFLLAKYPQNVNGTIGDGGVLTCRGHKQIKLLPWRIERRFTELKNIIQNGTLEDVSTLRFAVMDGKLELAEQLYRECDLAVFLGESAIASVYAVMAAENRIANVLLKLADGKSVSIECSALLPPDRTAVDRHEIIARRGIACDRTVDTQVPQESIYVFKPGVTQTYTDVDAELFGLDTAEIWLVRAAFAVLKNPQLGQQWQAADQAQQPVMQAIYQSAADGRTIKMMEEK